jgi:hypothetical protein
LGELKKDAMNNKKSTPRKCKQYDEYFKRSTVKPWLADGKSI